MKCNNCKEQSVYTRKYSGENLCAECFSNSIVRKTVKTISKYKMIKKDDFVCVGVSGGKDSLALLYVLSQMAKDHNFKIIAVTIDEGIPGYRDEALDIVKNFCTNLKVEYKIFSYKNIFNLTLDEALTLRSEDKKKVTATSSCSICGTFRRRALDYAVREIGGDVIATAHNLDDNLQTFLINMISGDTNKIGWMDPTSQSTPSDNYNIRRIKPFCEVYEAEIVFFAFINNIPFQTEPCPHMNEGIRTEIREFLNLLEDRHSGIKNNLYRSTLKITQIVRDTNYKQKIICSNCGNQCTGDVCSVCNIILNLKKDC